MAGNLSATGTIVNLLDQQLTDYEEKFLMELEAADRFADHWIKSWNSHDLDEILSHYTDDFEMSSPVIVATMNEPSGKLKGKEIIRNYWSKALARYPDLRFEKLHVLYGAASLTIVYLGVRGLSAEVFLFDDDGKVHTAYAHYGPQ